MKFNADEIASVIQKEIEQYEQKIDVREVGRVLEVGDGIAQIYGLKGVMAGEMIEFPNGVMGQAFNLNENSVGAIILGDYITSNSKKGTKPKRRANCSACRWAMPCLAACLTRWEIRSTEKAPW